MKIKSLLLGSAAAMVAASGAQAADIIDVFVASPEPVEYVRVCDAYGAGYFYIPGTDTCMRISGYVRTDLKGGDNVYASQFSEINRDTYAWRTRATVRFNTMTETNYGTLGSFVELRSQWDEGAELGGDGDTAGGQVRFAYITLGGLRVGLDESIFNHWTGYLGNMLNDDVVNPMLTERTNVLSYTFSNGNGFSAIIGVEQGNNIAEEQDGAATPMMYDDSTGAMVASTMPLSSRITGYTPNFLGGLKFMQGWGGVSAVAAYDSYYEEWAAKVRLDLVATERWGLWLMAGYKSADDYYTQATDGTGYYRLTNSLYGDWGGDWSIWAGTSFAFTPYAMFNMQLSYDDRSTFAAGANVAFQVANGFTITPELTYVSWDDEFDAGDPTTTLNSLNGQNAFQGMVRLQRSF